MGKFFVCLVGGGEMLYLQCFMPMTRLKMQNKVMLSDTKRKKKCLCSETDYLIALDIFSNWEKFYQHKKELKHASNSPSGELWRD